MTTIDEFYMRMPQLAEDQTIAALAEMAEEIGPEVLRGLLDDLFFATTDTEMPK